MCERYKKALLTQGVWDPERQRCPHSIIEKNHFFHNDSRSLEKTKINIHTIPQLGPWKIWINTRVDAPGISAFKKLPKVNEC